MANRHGGNNGTRPRPYPLSNKLNDSADGTLSPVTVIPTKFQLNKLLSDSLDETLKLQGVSDQKRAAIANFSVTLEPHQYIDDAGVEHIDVKQTLVGGLDAPSDNFVLDDEDHFKDHDLVGPLFIKSGRIKVNELGVNFLKEDWTDDTLEDGLIYSIARSHTEKTNKDWVVHLVWGLTIKDGVKRSARRFRFTTKDRSEPIDVRLYYDLSGYLSSSPSSPFFICCSWENQDIFDNTLRPRDALHVGGYKGQLFMRLR